jgi:CarD family transcriptional regulator
VEFSIGDIVVHPSHGAGRILDIEQKELLDGEKRYYVIEIPARELTIYVPRHQIEQAGVRAAIPRGRLPVVLATLSSKPRHLPSDYRERQEVVWEKIRTGRVMQIAEAVRDLTWHKKLWHLTKRDTELLAQGKDRLAAEMALVVDTDVTDMEDAIENTLSAALSDEPGDPERREPPFSRAVKAAVL